MALARLVSVLFALGLMVAVAACSNPVDTSRNNLPWDGYSAPSGPDIPPCDAGVAGCDCITVGDWYRFDTLALTSITGDNEHSVMDVLNPIWEGDIEKRELNILFEVLEVTDQFVRVRGANGARLDNEDYVDASVCLLADTDIELTFPRTGCSMCDSNATPFNVYAGGVTYPKNCAPNAAQPNVIPVEAAVLNGLVDEGCERMAGTVPAGLLARAALDLVCACLLLTGGGAEECGELDASYDSEGLCVGCNPTYKSLSLLLESFGLDIVWDTKAADGLDGATLTAAWSAYQLDAAPSPCP